jgi:hypothetical protein
MGIAFHQAMVETCAGSPLIQFSERHETPPADAEISKGAAAGGAAATAARSRLCTGPSNPPWTATRRDMSPREQTYGGGWLERKHGFITAWSNSACQAEQRACHPAAREPTCPLQALRIAAVLPGSTSSRLGQCCRARWDLDRGRPAVGRLSGGGRGGGAWARLAVLRSCCGCRASSS